MTFYLIINIDLPGLAGRFSTAELFERWSNDCSHQE